MEDIIRGWKKLSQAVKNQPTAFVLFVLVSLAVAFIANLPVLILNHSWLDGSVFIKSFYNAASSNVNSGADMIQALQLDPLGSAGLWVFFGSFWKYLILIPFQIVFFLPFLSGKGKSVWTSLKKFPAVLGIQIFSGLAVVVLAAIGIALTIALFAGAAAPFFMIIVMIAVLFLIIILILAPFGYVVDDMPVVKSVTNSLNHSLKFGWTIFLVLIIPSIAGSMIDGWLGNIGVVGDLIALAFFLPQYSALLAVYERMAANV